MIQWSCSCEDCTLLYHSSVNVLEIFFTVFTIQSFYISMWSEKWTLTDAYVFLFISVMRIFEISVRVKMGFHFFSSCLVAPQGEIAPPPPLPQSKRWLQHHRCRRCTGMALLAAMGIVRPHPGDTCMATRQSPLTSRAARKTLGVTRRKVEHSRSFLRDIWVHT